MSSSHPHAAVAARHRTSDRGARAGLHRGHRAPRYRRPLGARLSATEIALLLLLVVALLLCVFFSRTPQVPSGRMGLVRVGAGDTVWELARVHPAAGLSTAQTVQLITEINDLHGRSLIPGTQVRVPIPARADVASR